MSSWYSFMCHLDNVLLIHYKKVLTCHDTVLTCHHDKVHHDKVVMLRSINIILVQFGHVIYIQSQHVFMLQTIHVIRSSLQRYFGLIQPWHGALWQVEAMSYLWPLWRWAVHPPCPTVGPLHLNQTPSLQQENFALQKM